VRQSLLLLHNTLLPWKPQCRSSSPRLSSSALCWQQRSTGCCSCSSELAEVLSTLKGQLGEDWQRVLKRVVHRDRHRQRNAGKAQARLQKAKQELQALRQGSCAH